MMSIRYDRGEIQAKHLTDEGFLKVDAIVTRTGVFKYRNADGSVRNELRHPEDVLNADSLKSMELIPITLLHPKERVVDSTNARKLMRGAVGQKITHDGNQIKASIVITDQETIDAIQNGVQELSLGYGVMAVIEDGTFEGERYDVRQTQIKYNHLAVVPKGRAGVAKVLLDAEDAEQYHEDSNNPNPQPKKESHKMKTSKIILDGLDYDVAPEVAREIEKKSKLVADKAAELETLKAERSELQAKFDSKSEEVEKLKKVDHSEDIQKAVKGRISLISSALKHLDGDDAKDLELKSDSEIKTAVIKKYSPDAKLDDAEDAYIQARFDLALENDPTKNDTVAKLAAQRVAVKTVSKEEKKVDAREGYIEGLKNRYKSKGEN